MSQLLKICSRHLKRSSYIPKIWETSSVTVFENRKCFNPHLCSQRNAFTVQGVHEPEYLEYLKPQIPFYELVNIQIKGYDFAILESYGSYLHRLSNKLGLNVVKYWCSPHTATKIETLVPESTVVEASYELNLYERNIQIKQISSRFVSLLVEIAHRSLPVGVQLSVHEHEYELHEKPRYIPDHELASYKEDLALLRNSKMADDDVTDTGKKKK